MLLKILKTLVIISYLLITIDTGHIGGPFGIILLFGFFADGLSFLLATFCFLSLISIILSEMRKIKKIEFYVFIVSGVVLLIPIIMHIHFLLQERKKSGDTMFYITTGIFFVLYGITLYKIYMKKKEVIVV